MRKITIIGVGRLGGALAIALSRSSGFAVENLVVRNQQTANKISGIIEPKPLVAGLENLSLISSDIIFITTQDSEIEAVAESLKGKLGATKPFIFHTSGALSSEILKPLRETGCPTGSIHPLVSLSD